MSEPVESASERYAPLRWRDLLLFLAGGLIVGVLIDRFLWDLPVAVLAAFMLVFVALGELAKYRMRRLARQYERQDGPAV